MTESLMTSLRTGADARLTRGVVAGLAAGLLFLLANMWYADSQGMPAVAPLYDISTIFHFADTPQPSPENLAVGLIVHLTLSAAFGATFALLAPVARGSTRLVAASGSWAHPLRRELLDPRPPGVRVVPGGTEPDVRDLRPPRLRAAARPIHARIRADARVTRRRAAPSGGHGTLTRRT